MNIPHIYDVRPVDIHPLRHTCACALILAGLNELEVARHMGHEKSTTTRDIYAHWFDLRKQCPTMAALERW